MAQLKHPPIREWRFWSTQLMVLGVVALHAVVDVGQDRGVWGVPSFVVIPLLLVPVIYGAMSYGLVGALGPALVGAVLLAPTELWLAHSPAQLWAGWGNIAAVVCFALILGDRFELTRSTIVEHTQRRVRVREERRFQLAFDNNLSAMALVNDQGAFERVNRAMCDLVGYDEADLLSMRLSELTHPDEAVLDSLDFSVPTSPGREVTRLICRDGRTISAEVVATRVSDELEDDGASVVSIRDLTEERTLTARLVDLALHDALTGLANRSLLRDRMAQASARVSRDGGRVVLYLIDLDNFKDVNDTLGHAAGDELLIGVANRLRETTREVDTICRLGGDEFIVLVMGATDDDPIVMAERLLGLFVEPFDVTGQSVIQGASIGVVFCAAPSASNCDDLVRDADIALYEAKRRGRGQIVVYSPVMSTTSNERFQLGQELALAAERDQLDMYFQPIVELATGRVAAFEALMRWRHPERGFVPPDLFIPIAEQSELIVQLGAFALERATRAAAQWQRDGRAWQVGVNLSVRQMGDATLLATIDSSLEAAALAATSLVVEITEGIAIADVDAAIATIDQLRQRGIAIVLDDFGTGYSSLAYLARLRPSTIKIDRSFVSAATVNQTDRNVLSAVVTLCRQLRMLVLAEGVETSEELELLVGLGVDLAQGFLFSPAVPASEVPAVVARIEGSLMVNDRV